MGMEPGCGREGRPGRGWSPGCGDGWPGWEGGMAYLSPSLKLDPPQWQGTLLFLTSWGPPFSASECGRPLELLWVDHRYVQYWPALVLQARDPVSRSSSRRRMTGARYSACAGQRTSGVDPPPRNATSSSPTTRRKPQHSIHKRNSQGIGEGPRASEDTATPPFLGK